MSAYRLPIILPSSVKRFKWSFLLTTRLENMVDEEMDTDFTRLTWGNLSRWKRWKHCSFLRQGSN